MPRKTLIFGNGLGMALDPHFFTLDHAIGEVWGNGDLLDEACKELVCHCLPPGNSDRPHGEHDLDILQLALSASDFLAGLGGGQFHWLTDEGQRFPNAIRKFFYQTALRFHLRDCTLPDAFLNDLSEYIQATRSHIATLNYDNLLYQPLIERQVLRGYNGPLVDGFYNDGFKADNFERKYGRTFGYYLHLHGSPLFVNRGESVLKLKRAKLDLEADTISSHIVLTHVDHKLAVISASELLIAYWQRLLFSLSESEEIILFGYSGGDEHLNSLLKSSSPDKSVRVVEWNGAGSHGDRMEFWTASLSRDVTLVRLDNILNFNSWE
jgi:hypothetical protein